MGAYSIYHCCFNKSLLDPYLYLCGVCGVCGVCAITTMASKWCPIGTKGSDIWLKRQTLTDRSLLAMDQRGRSFTRAGVGNLIQHELLCMQITAPSEHLWDESEFIPKMFTRFTLGRSTKLGPRHSSVPAPSDQSKWTETRKNQWPMSCYALSDELYS